MQNEKSETYGLKIEKTITKPPSEVFRAIAEGRLFMNCSADSQSLKIDFRVGGKYRVEFQNHEVMNHGEFIEIIPNEKIVFSWCQTYEPDSKPDTLVTIVMNEKNGNTELTLTHTGFTDQEGMESHQGGWTGGLNDLTQEMTEGRLRFMRKCNLSVQQLRDTCKDANSFFGLIGKVQNESIGFKVGGSFKVASEKGEVFGKFLEISPDQICFTWNSPACGEVQDSKVTLTFESDDDDQNISWLGLTHEGLINDSAQKSHRLSWDNFFAVLNKKQVN